MASILRPRRWTRAAWSQRVDEAGEDRLGSAYSASTFFETACARDPWTDLGRRSGDDEAGRRWTLLVYVTVATAKGPRKLPEHSGFVDKPEPGPAY